jgi:hypothetical protein
MNIKSNRFLLSLASFLIISSAGLSQSDDEIAKNACKVIWLVAVASGDTGMGHFEPDDYVRDSTTNKITGQRLLSYMNSNKYMTIALHWKEKSIPKAHVDGLSVRLYWDQGRVIGIQIPNYGADYSVAYNSIGEVIALLGSKLLNGNINIIKELKLTNGKLEKYIGYETLVGKKKWTRCIRTYTYHPNEVLVSCLVYNTGQPNKPGNARENTGSFKKITDDSFVIETSPTERIETHYDKFNRLILKRSINGTYITGRRYTYQNDKLFKEEEFLEADGQSVVQYLRLNYSLTDTDTTVAEYHWKEGIYNFDKKGELTSQSRAGKFRKKKDGVWSKWRLQIIDY